MIMYLSGGWQYLKPPLAKRVPVEDFYLLFSYYYVANRREPHRCRESYRHLLTRSSGLFADSGGFTARMHNIEIPLEHYASFITAHNQYFEAFANLDFGGFEVMLKNQQLLDRVSDKVLPVFHPNEFLEKRGREWFLDEIKQREYVAVGGVANVSGGDYLMARADKLGYFKYIFHHAIKYRTKVHGFGITSMDFLYQYPFYSVDSTTWLTVLRYNRCPRFDFKRGRLIRNWTRKNLAQRTAPGQGKDQSVMEDIVFLTGTKEDRILTAMREFGNVSRHVTQVWRERGNGRMYWE